MGGRYMVRTDEVREYPLVDKPTTDYYINTLWELIKLLITKRGKILFVTRWF